MAEEQSNKQVKIIDHESKADKTTLTQMLLAYNTDANVHKLKEYYAQKSLAEILNVARNETAHSSFLSWLFNPNSHHGLGIFPLEMLLQIIAQRALMIKGVCPLTDTIINNILLQKYNLNRAISTTEYTLESRKRLDILIERIQIDEEEINIIIENKVLSSEHDNQTNTYYTQFPKDLKGKAKTNIFLYLSPITNSDLDFCYNEEYQPHCECRAFIQINYQQIMDKVLSPCLMRDIPKETEFKIKDYINCLTFPSITEIKDNKNTKQITIMATSENETKLLNEFWNNNKDLILMAIQAMENTADDEEEQASFKKLYHLATQTYNSTRDYSRYTIHFTKGEPDFTAKECTLLNKIEFIKMICRILAKRQNFAYNESLAKIKEFETLAQQNYNGTTLRILRYDLKNGRDKYEQVRAHKIEIEKHPPLWIDSQWSSKKMPHILTAVHKVLPDLEIEITK